MSSTTSSPISRPKLPLESLMHCWCKSSIYKRFAGRCVESKPSSYFDLLKRKGVNASVVDTLVRILDCHSDPLGWKDCVPPLETARNSSIKENNAFVRDEVSFVRAWWARYCMDIVLKHIVSCNLYRFMKVSTMVASVQPIMQCNNQQTSPANLLWLEKNSHKAKFHVRLKCDNGKVQLLEPAGPLPPHSKSEMLQA